MRLALIPIVAVSSVLLASPASAGERRSISSIVLDTQDHHRSKKDIKHDRDAKKSPSIVISSGGVKIVVSPSDSRLGRDRLTRSEVRQLQRYRALRPRADRRHRFGRHDDRFDSRSRHSIQRDRRFIRGFRVGVRSSSRDRAHSHRPGLHRSEFRRGFRAGARTTRLSPRGRHERRR
ncbi:MAG: hypothetical protein AAGI53_15650 [Planctomycetota bacterium]